MSSHARKDDRGTIDPMATVLVVDDEPIVREVVVRYLEREGYATLEAATATTRARSSSASRPTSSSSTSCSRGRTGSSCAAGSAHAPSCP